jgi:hypothetical protein
MRIDYHRSGKKTNTPKAKSRDEADNRKSVKDTETGVFDQLIRSAHGLVEAWGELVVHASRVASSGRSPICIREWVGFTVVAPQAANPPPGSSETSLIPLRSTRIAMETEVAHSPALEAVRARLATHPLYEELNTRERVQIFMRQHVFAVWDFFSLLKRLQNEVTCVTVPWLPRGLGAHARFISQIVLDEECDKLPSGHRNSHFELYLAAMDEIGADRTPIDALIGGLSAEMDPLCAIELPEIPAPARSFVKHTLGLALHGEPHEVAASFCYGRENLLSDVFTSARAGMSEVLADAPTLQYYLDRHITLDHDEHGPLALELLEALCNGDPARIEAAAAVAVEAAEARTLLWDGILEEIRLRDRHPAAADTPAPVQS